jgi:dihydrofolate reductase
VTEPVGEAPTDDDARDVRELDARDVTLAEPKTKALKGHFEKLGLGNALIIGGAEIYRQAEPLASTAVVTEIDADFEGDAFAPDLRADWTECQRESHVGSHGLAFSFVTYQHV